MQIVTLLGQFLKIFMSQPIWRTWRWWIFLPRRQSSQGTATRRDQGTPPSYARVIAAAILRPAWINHAGLPQEAPSCPTPAGRR